MNTEIARQQFFQALPEIMLLAGAALLCNILRIPQYIPEGWQYGILIAIAVNSALVAHICKRFSIYLMGVTPLFLKFFSERSFEDLLKTLAVVGVCAGFAWFVVKYESRKVY